MDKSLEIEGTTSTPNIHFDIEKKEFLVSGRSLPSDAVSTFVPVFAFIKQLSSHITLRMRLDYFNTASSKNFLELFNMLPDGSTVLWEYEEGDEDFEESGEDYQNVVKKTISFKLVTYYPES